jgi:hypothetical protein
MVSDCRYAGFMGSRELLPRLSNADQKAAIQKMCADHTMIGLSRRKSLGTQVQARLGDKYELMEEIASGKFSNREPSSGILPPQCSRMTFAPARILPPGPTARRSRLQGHRVFHFE